MRAKNSMMKTFLGFEWKNLDQKAPITVKGNIRPAKIIANIFATGIKINGANITIASLLCGKNKEITPKPIGKNNEWLNFTYKL